MTSNNDRIPPLSEFKVAWLCVLDIEEEAAWYSFDYHYNERYEVRGDDNIYRLGRIGSFNIILVKIPGQGIAGAASALTNLDRSFPTGQIYTLFVGVAGGVPKTINSRADIRLGDVVISTPNKGHPGIVQYDFGKREIGGTFVDSATLNKPHPALIPVVHRFKDNLKQQRTIYNTFKNKLTIWFEGYPKEKEPWYDPGATNDTLYPSECDRVDGNSDNPHSRNCENCGLEHAVKRDPVPNEKRPQIHTGLIASGSAVIKDAKTRDRFVASLKESKGQAYCFEMEGAGIAEKRQCLILRGICDYADSRKNERWQKYAALTAATCTKTILLELQATERPPLPADALPKTRNFKPGTGEILCQMEVEEVKCNGYALGPSRCSLYSLDIPGFSLRSKMLVLKSERHGEKLLWIPSDNVRPLPQFIYAWADALRPHRFPPKDGYENWRCIYDPEITNRRIELTFSHEEDGALFHEKILDTGVDRQNYVRSQDWEFGDGMPKTKFYALRRNPRASSRPSDGGRPSKIRAMLATYKADGALELTDLSSSVNLQIAKGFGSPENIFSVQISGLKYLRYTTEAECPFEEDLYDDLIKTNPSGRPDREHWRCLDGDRSITLAKEVFDQVVKFASAWQLRVLLIAREVKFRKGNPFHSAAVMVWSHSSAGRRLMLACKDGRGSRGPHGGQRYYSAALPQNRDAFKLLGEESLQVTLPECSFGTGVALDVLKVRASTAVKPLRNCRLTIVFEHYHDRHGFWTANFPTPESN